MHRLKPGSNRSTRIPSSIHDMFAVMVLSVVKQCLNAGLRETPGTSVERLLLTPHDGFGVGVHVEIVAELLPGEGVELFEAGEGDVVDFLVGAIF